MATLQILKDGRWIDIFAEDDHDIRIIIAKYEAKGYRMRVIQKRKRNKK